MKLRNRLNRPIILLDNKGDSVHIEPKSRFEIKAKVEKDLPDSFREAIERGALVVIEEKPQKEKPQVKSVHKSRRTEPPPRRIVEKPKPKETAPKRSDERESLDDVEDFLRSVGQKVETGKAKTRPKQGSGTHKSRKSYGTKDTGSVKGTSKEN